MGHPEIGETKRRLAGEFRFSLQLHDHPRPTTHAHSLTYRHLNGEISTSCLSVETLEAAVAVVEVDLLRAEVREASSKLFFEAL